MAELIGRLENKVSLLHPSVYPIPPGAPGSAESGGEFRREVRSPGKGCVHHTGPRRGTRAEGERLEWWAGSQEEQLKEQIVAGSQVAKGHSFKDALL